MVVKEKPRAFLLETNRIVSDSSGFYQSGPPTKTTFNWVDSREGTKVNGWRTLIRLGLDASSDLTAYQHSIDAKKGHYIRRQWQDVSNKLVVQTREVNGHLFSFPPMGTESIDWSAADNEARSGIYKKIKALQTQMQGQVFLGELGEAMRMLKSPARALRTGLSEYLDALRRGKAKIQLKRDRMRFASETWLEYKFGFLPLVNDIEDAAKAVSQIVNRFTRKRVSDYSTMEQASTASVMIYPLGLFEDACLSTTRTKTKVKVIWRAGLRFDAEGPSNLETFSNSFGLTLRDFVPTAWELLPYSFVVDYFSNVGDILSAYFTDTSMVTWSNRTVVIETVRENTTMIQPELVKAAVGANYIDCRGSPSSYTATSKLVRRYAVGLSAPSFRVTYPGSGSTKWINLTALGHQHRSLLPFWK